MGPVLGVIESAAVAHVCTAHRQYATVGGLIDEEAEPHFIFLAAVACNIGISIEK